MTNSLNKNNPDKFSKFLDSLPPSQRIKDKAKDYGQISLDAIKTPE